MKKIILTFFLFIFSTLPYFWENIFGEAKIDNEILRFKPGEIIPALIIILIFIFLIFFKKITLKKNWCLFLALPIGLYPFLLRVFIYLCWWIGGFAP